MTGGAGHTFLMNTQRTPVVSAFLALVAMGLLAVSCTGDDSTEATQTESESEPTVQTLDTAEPAEAAEPADDEATTQAPGLALDPAGLTILDPVATTTELLAFGDDQGGVIAGLEAVLGSADEIGEGSSECPNGQATVATWDGTLMVDFSADEEFLSWSVPPESDLTTTGDVGVGSPVSDLGEVSFVDGSTLGDEFEIGGLRGLAAGTGDDALIDRLWAGEVCAFR